MKLKLSVCAALACVTLLADDEGVVPTVSMPEPPPCSETSTLATPLRTRQPTSESANALPVFAATLVPADGIDVPIGSDAKSWVLASRAKLPNGVAVFSSAVNG